MAQRLVSLANALGVPPSALMPVPAHSPNFVVTPKRGIQLVLRHPEIELADADRWVISDVLFDSTWADPMPFGLDANVETPFTAEAKLGSDTTPVSATAGIRGDRRQSFTLDDARVVEILWRSTYVGFERVWIARLGTERPKPPELGQA